MLDFETVVRKFVRLPWEVWRTRPHPKDKEIADYVAYSGQAGTDYRDPPKDDAEYEQILHAIANVMVIAFLTQRGEALDRNNRFRDLSNEEKAFLFDRLAINPLEHDSVLQIVKKPEAAARIASYIAAAYALTTQTKILVANFEYLAGVAYQAQRELSPGEKTIRGAGLFIVTELGAPSRFNETTYAFLLHMLNMRAALRRMNVFFDTAHKEVLRKFNRNLLPSRDDVEDYYLEAYPAQFMMENHLIGGHVHIPFIDAVPRTREAE